MYHSRTSGYAITLSQNQAHDPVPRGLAEGIERYAYRSIVIGDAGHTTLYRHPAALFGLEYNDQTLAFLEMEIGMIVETGTPTSEIHQPGFHYRPIRLQWLHIHGKPHEFAEVAPFLDPLHFRGMLEDQRATGRSAHPGKHRIEAALSVVA